MDPDEREGELELRDKISIQSLWPILCTSYLMQHKGSQCQLNTAHYERGTTDKTTTIRMLWVRVVASSRPHLTILSITEMRTADDSCRGEKGLLASLPSFSLSTTIIAAAFLPSSSVRPWMARPFARRFCHFAMRLYYAYSGSCRYLNGFRLRGFTFCRHPLHLARVCSTSEPYFTSHCDESDLKMNAAARQSLKGRMIKIPDIGIIWCRRIKGAQGPCRSQHTDRLSCLGPFFYSWQQAVQIWRLCFSLFPSHLCSRFRFYYTLLWFFYKSHMSKKRPSRKPSKTKIGTQRPRPS